VSGAPVDAVLFDAGGVLVVPDHTVLGPLLAPYGGSLDRAVHHRAHYLAMRAHDIGDDTGWHQYHVTYVAAVGVPDDELEHAVPVLRDTFNSWLWRYPNEGAVDVLHTLVERDVPIGVVSNASGQIEAVLRRLGVCQVGAGDGPSVLCVVDSHVVGVSKPDPAIFASALELLGVPPERVAYVGDSIRYDVEGARAAGLVPVLLDPYTDTDGAGHTRITSLRELLAWFPLRFDAR
jgi:putative hydrolase of the HAD superfamily